MDKCFEKQIANDINELKELIESREGVEIENSPINKKESIFDFYPVNLSKGNPNNDYEARPTIVISVDGGNGIFTLHWLYLRFEDKGTGTLIFEWIKKYCINNNFKVFEVKSVGQDKIGMHKLCKNMGFQICEEIYTSEGIFYNYRYEFK